MKWQGHSVALGPVAVQAASQARSSYDDVSSDHVCRLQKPFAALERARVLTKYSGHSEHVRNPILLHLITLSRTNLHFTHTVTLVHAHDHMSYACPGLCTDSVGI